MLAVGARARHLGLDLQAVARALHLLDPGQFADRGVQQVEGLAGFQRDLDQPLLPVAERVGIGAAGDQADPVQVRERTGHHQRHRRHPGQHHREFELAYDRDAGIQRGDEHHRQTPSRGDAQDEEQLLEQGLEHAGGLAGRVWKMCAEHSEAGGRRKRPGDETRTAATKPGWRVATVRQP